jgi:hypothetical protein
MDDPFMRFRADDLPADGQDEGTAGPRRRRSFIQEIGAFRKTLAAITLREHERESALEHLTLLSQEIVSAISRLRRSGPGVRLVVAHEGARKAV